MNSKDSILQKIWDGKIPICFRLAPSELSPGDTAPAPVFLLVPRVTYFPLVLEKTVRQLRRYLDTLYSSVGSPAGDHQTSLLTDQGDELNDNLSMIAKKPSNDSCVTKNNSYWLEFDSIPLKWHYAVGLLYDLYGSSQNLPWEIHVHFENYPDDVLLSPPVNRSSVEAIFMSTVKEADVLKHRSSVINDMQPRDHRQLWTGLLNHGFKQFWSINQRFMTPYKDSKPNATLQRKSSLDPKDVEELDNQLSEKIIPYEGPSSLPIATGLKTFRYYPFRLYFRNIVDEVRSKLPAYVQCRLEPFNTSGLPIAFSEAINSLFAVQAVAASNLNKNDFQFLVHGIIIPYETPVQWMSENMAYPDNFVHVVARQN